MKQGYTVENGGNLMNPSVICQYNYDSLNSVLSVQFHGVFKSANLVAIFKIKYK